MYTNAYTNTFTLLLLVGYRIVIVRVKHLLIYIIFNYIIKIINIKIIIISYYIIIYIYLFVYVLYFLLVGPCTNVVSIYCNCYCMFHCCCLLYHYYISLFVLACSNCYVYVNKINVGLCLLIE